MTCGIGWCLRRFECKSNRGNETVEVAKCRADRQPMHYEQCDAGECPRWQHGSWSPCSSECGEGVRRRLVVCLGSNGLVTDDESVCSSSSSAQKRPLDQEKCTGVDGCARWHTTAWSECDFKSCTKVRSVYCAHSENGTRLPNEIECSKSDKPNYIAECDSRASCRQYQTNFASIGGTTNDQTNTPLGYLY